MAKKVTDNSEEFDFSDIVETSNGGEEFDFTDIVEPVKKKAPIGLGYEKPSEALRMGGVPKQETISQSPLKTAATTTPSVSTKTNSDYLTDINNLYKEKVKATEERVNTKRELLNLQPKIESVYGEIETLNAIYNDPNTPLQERNKAAEQANLLIGQVEPIKQQYDLLGAKYNELVGKDREAISKLKQVDSERQIQLQKDFGFSKDLLEKTGKGFVDAAAGVAGIFNTLGLSGDTEGGEDYDQEEVKQQTRQNIDKIRAFGNSLVTQETPKEWQSVFEGKMTPKKLMYVTNQAVASTIPTVAAGLFTGGTGTGLVGSGMGFNESKDILKDAGLNDTQAEWASLGLAIPLGLLEEYGAGDVVKILSSPTIKKKVATELVRKIAGKEITKDLLFNETKKSLGKVIADNAGAILTTGVKEAGTEAAQGTLQEIAKQTAEEYTGVNPDDQMPFDEYMKGFIKQRGEEAVGGFLGGTTLQTAGQGIQTALSGFKPNFAPSVYAQVKEFTDPEKLQEFQEDLQGDVEQGIVTPEQADEAMQNVQAIIEADVLIPSTIKDNDIRTNAVNLIIEKNRISAEIEGKEKSLVTPQSERIKQIDEQLVAISKGQPIVEVEEQVDESELSNKITNGEQATTIEEETIETPSSETITDTIVSDGSATPTAVESTEVAPEVVSETVSDIEPPVVEETTTDVGSVTAPDVSEALKDVESTAKALGASSLKFTDTPSLKNVEAISLEDANLSATEEVSAIETINQNNENESWDKALRGDAKNIGNGWFKVGSTMSGESILYSPEKNNAIVIKGAKVDGIAVQDFVKNNFGNPKETAEAYHKAKADDSNPELVAAVEQLLGAETKVSESTRKSENLAVSKTERITKRKAIAEAKVDEVANKAKDFLGKYLASKGIDNVKKSGFGDQNKIVDVLANTVKALVNAGIEIDEAIKEVRAYFDAEYDTSGIEDYEIKQSIARDELTDYAKEQGFTSYRNAVFAVNKYVKPVGKEDVITKEDIDKAKEAKAEVDKEDEAPKGKTLSGRSKSYEEKRVPVSEQYREAVNAKKVFYQAEGLQSFADAAIEYLADFGDSIQGFNNAYDDMVKVYNENPYYRAYNSIAIELLSDRLFAEGEKAYLDDKVELANQLFAKSDNLRVMAFNAARKAGQYNAALAIFSSSVNPDAFAMFVNKEINKEADKIRAIKQPKIDEGVKEFKSKVRKAQSEAASEAVKTTPRKQVVRTSKFSELKERGVKRQKEALSKLKKLGFLGSNGLNNEAIEAIGELIVAQLEIGVYKAANIIQRVKSMTNGNVTDEHIKETYDKYKIKYEGSEYSLTELSDLLAKQEQAELLKADPEKFIEQQAKEKLSAGKGKTLTLSELLERDLIANETAEGISKNIQQEFGLSEKEANVIANKFYDKYKYLLKSKIEKALMSSLGVKNVKEIERRESAGEIKPFEKTLGGKIVAEVLAGALDSSQAIEDAFSVKYGIPVMTPTIRDNIRQLSKRVNAATTILGQRTANRNLISYIQEQLPTSAGSVLKTAYYVSLLSGISTAAVNTWGNVNTLMNQAVGENFVQSIIEAFQGNKANLVSSVQGKAKLRSAITNMNRALVAFTDIMARGGGENKYYNLNQKAINEFDSERLILKKQDLKNLGLNRLAAALGKLYYTAPAIINRNLSASDEAFYSLNYNVEATREVRKKLYKETGLRGKELEDAVFQEVYGTKEIMLEAMIEAEKEMLNIGMTPSSNKKLAKRIAYELISRKLDKEVQNTAEKIAAENTYRGELRGAMGYIGTVVPQMALITPFVNTVVKIAEKHMNYIPFYGIARTLGFSLTDNLRAVKDINDYFERKGIEKAQRTGELRNKQIAQVILSHSLLGVFYALSQMSWYDEDDDKEKPLLEVSGGYIGMPYAKQQQGREIMPEYTLRIKDFKINYKNNPLLAMICLPLAVKMDNDRMGLKTERPINSYSFALGMYLYDAVPIKNIQEFFTSLAKTTDKFSDVEPEDMVKEVVKSFAMIPANLLAPNTYKQIFDYMNPQKYQTNDYKDALWKAVNMEKIGGLIPTYDMWGKPVKMYPGETFMPIQYILRDDKDDDVTQWAVSKNISLPSLNRKTLVLDLDSKTGYTKKEWDKKQARDNAEFLTVEMQELAEKANFRVLTYSEWAEMDATIRNNVYQIISRNLDKVADNDEMIEMLNVIDVPLNEMTSKKANKAVDILFELERQKYINDKFLKGLENDNTN